MKEKRVKKKFILGNEIDDEGEEGCQ